MFAHSFSIHNVQRSCLILIASINMENKQNKITVSTLITNDRYAVKPILSLSQPFDWIGVVIHIQTSTNLEQTKTLIVLRSLSVTHALQTYLYRIPLSSDQYFCLVFGMSRVKISARKPAILTDGFRGFPQPFQANGGRVPKNRSRLPPSISFPIHHSPTNSKLYSKSYRKASLKSYKYINKSIIYFQ
jgi:hypothetical protein